MAQNRIAIIGGAAIALVIVVMGIIGNAAAQPVATPTSRAWPTAIPINPYCKVLRGYLTPPISDSVRYQKDLLAWRAYGCGK